MGKGTNFERRLRHDLRSEGYFVTRTAGSGSWHGDAADLVAMKAQSSNLVIECKSLSEESLPYNVKEDDNQLSSIDELTGKETKVMYAVEIKNRVLDRYHPAPAGNLTMDSMEMLHEVTE